MIFLTNMTQKSFEKLFGKKKTILNKRFQLNEEILSIFKTLHLIEHLHYCEISSFLFFPSIFDLSILWPKLTQKNFFTVSPICQSNEIIQIFSLQHEKNYLIFFFFFGLKRKKNTIKLKIHMIQIYSAFYFYVYKVI